MLALVATGPPPSPGSSDEPAPPAAGAGAPRARTAGGLTAVPARYVAAAMLLLPALVEFAPGTSRGVPHLLGVLLLTAGWGLSLHLLTSRGRAERATGARDAVAADEERRRVARDLHDGAQQRLVHTILVLKLACQADVEAGVARILIGEALEQTQAAHRELRALARGISPPVLRRGGLAAGVQALVERAPVPVAVDVSVGRLPSAVEAAAYFVIAEALTNVAKHARARTASVAAWLDAGVLRTEVCDDGVGGADRKGHGLAGLSERVAELDGEFEVTTSPGSGTRLAAAIPLPR